MHIESAIEAHNVSIHGVADVTVTAAEGGRYYWLEITVESRDGRDTIALHGDRETVARLAQQLGAAWREVA